MDMDIGDTICFKAGSPGTSPQYKAGFLAGSTSLGSAIIAQHAYDLRGIGRFYCPFPMLVRIRTLLVEKAP